MESDKIKKVLFFFDSRATFAYSNNIISEFKKNKKKYITLVSGNFLDKKFGIQKNIFKINKININKKITFKSPNLKSYSWPAMMGESMIGYSKSLDKFKPDLLVLTGDRIETLAMCICASYMNVPIAHIQAGDKSGHIDDLSRAAIAKYSHLHFAPSLQACRRLEEWGEKKNRIFFTGAPQLDDMFKIKNKNKKINYFVIIFHPVLNEKMFLENQINNLIKALVKENYKIKWIFPNNDMGHNIIIDKLKTINFKNFEIIKNLERKEFLSLLKNSRGIIGNSSCGIIEASMYKLPVINIGNRQNGRPQTKNIINTDYEEKNISKAIKIIKSKKIKKIKNPFYKKNSSKIIFKLIFKYSKDNKIFKKF